MQIKKGLSHYQIAKEQMNLIPTAKRHAYFEYFLSVGNIMMIDFRFSVN